MDVLKKICNVENCSNPSINNSVYCQKHHKELKTIVGKENIIKRNTPFKKGILINCPVCEKEISSESKKCINCGHPIKKNNSYSKKQNKVIKEKYKEKKSSGSFLFGYLFGKFF